MNPGTQTNIRDFIRERSRMITDPAGREVVVLEDAQVMELADECDCGIHAIYTEALDMGICPYRYLRNREIISLEDQLKLARARVAVVGAGGLGGHVILLLGRIGIGHLVVVDHDVFDETNMNRQALSSQKALGKSKSEEAVAVLGSINPGVEVSAHQVKLDPSNGFEILKGSDVVVDGLDNVPDRFLVEKVAKRLGIPMVHGALAGLDGQLMTIFPDDLGLNRLYGREGVNGDRSKSPESVLGVPALMPALMATLQAMEVLKIILKRGRVFRNVMVHVDLEAGQMNEFVFEDQ